MMIGDLLALSKKFIRPQALEIKKIQLQRMKLLYSLTTLRFGCHIIVMIQSYTEVGVVSLVVNKLRGFVRSYSSFISTDRFVHEK